MVVHEKSIVIDAPIHDVFRMWTRWEDFPQFMSHVKEVRTLDGGLTHWEGSVAGIPESWDARTTKMDEDNVIAWESVSGFANQGEIRFESEGDGTRLTVHFEYEPPAGVAGRAVEAVYVGKEFDDSLEHDLQHLKVKIEEARAEPPEYDMDDYEI